VLPIIKIEHLKFNLSVPFFLKTLQKNNEKALKFKKLIKAQKSYVFSFSTYAILLKTKWF
ncbi:hypothetical protein, partial [Chryseobacterium arthrosphaerae]|uniref:hypothetical protein n=1 Tax=Chryseobacterium arthrosphaerae TaxID=651561 RepID=UPI0024157F3C